MTHKISWLALYVLTMVTVVLLLSCNDDGPVGPRPVKDYAVYFVDPDGGTQIFAFYPIARRVDSSNVPWDAREGITVSPNGRLLYLAGRSEINVITSDSLTLIKTLPYAPDGAVAVSPDGRYVAIPGDSLVILRADNYSVLYTDSSAVQRGVFSSNSETYYASGLTDDGISDVFKLDLTTSPFSASRIPVSLGSVHSVRPASGESKLLLYLRLPPLWTWAFCVFDMDADSIGFTDVLVPGAGETAASPNSRFAFYSNPGRSATDPPPNFNFRVFDLPSSEVRHTITSFEFFSDSSWEAYANKMVVTPDSRWLVILGGSMALGVLYLYDIDKNEMVFREPFGVSGHVFTPPAVQFGP